MTEVIEGRRRNESVAQYRGRLRKENNVRVDALGLKSGDPVWFNGKRTRFDHTFMKRSDPRYQHIERLEPKDVAVLEADEKRRAGQIERSQAAEQERTAFHARPEVQAASRVLYILQDDMRKVVGKLTPKEWEALAAKLT